MHALPHQFLFISPSRLGDAVLSTCAIRHVFEQHPDAHMTVVAPSFLRSFYESMPFAHRIIVLKKKSFARHWLDIWHETRDTDWDTIVDMRGSCLAYVLRPKTQYVWAKSYGKKIQPLLHYDAKNILNLPFHKVFSINRMLRRTAIITPNVWYSDAARDDAQLRIQRPTLALAPTANWVGKQWPKESVAKLMRLFFQSSDPSHEILLVAAPNEEIEIRYLHAVFQDSLYHDRIKTLTSANLEKVAASLSLCDAFFGNDSGLMHMAAALGVPVIALFGPTDESVYGPFGARCQVVRGGRSYDQICASKGFRKDAPVGYMDDISVSHAFGALQSIWNGMHANVHNLADVPLASMG